ncbi:MAG: tetratricopeptide repeat protein [Myxococcota bacterium]
MSRLTIAMLAAGVFVANAGEVRAQEGENPATEAATEGSEGTEGISEAAQEAREGEEGADGAEGEPQDAADGEESAESGEQEGEEQSEESALEAPDAPGAAPEGADEQFKQEVQAFQKSYDRYAGEMKDYQGTIDSIVEAEYKKRVAEVNSKYDQRISALEAVERQRRLDAIATFQKFVERYPDREGYTPDALFRLAELYFEKANDDYLVADEEYQVKMAQFDRGEIPEMPEQPERDYGKPIAVFEQLIQDWPDYRMLDGAYYLLAYSELQMGNPERARDLFVQLVEERPDSDFVPEAYVRIGEYYFDYSDSPEGLRKAREAYESAIGFEDSKFYDKALYKLAWTYYRLDQFDRAIGEFKRLVEYSDEQKRKTGRSGSVLRAEAIQYIAVSLAEEDWNLDGAVDDEFGIERVRQYLDGDEDYNREVMVDLVDYLFENTRYDVAANVINLALGRYPRHPKNPELHEKLVLAYMRDGQTDKSFAERSKMIDYYGPESDWYELQERAGNEEAVRYANNLVRDNLIQSATWYHEQAQKLKNEAVVRENQQLLAEARQKYATAATAYERFLARYPNDKDIYQWNFYYAECLYYSGDYLPSYEQYRVVRELDIRDNKYQEVSAFNAIKALEFKLGELANQGEIPGKAVGAGATEEAAAVAQDQQSADTAQAEAAGEAGQENVEIRAEDIPELVTKYVTAMDRYIVLRLENNEDDLLDVKLAFQAAKIFYDFKHYPEARDRFAWIVDQYPETEYGTYAGSLILETYRQEKDYENLAKWAEKLEGVIKTEEVLKEIEAFKLGARFKSAEKFFAEKQYEKAAEEYLRLVEQSPDYKFAPKALNNAAVAYENIGKYDSAMKLYERVYNDYPDDSLAGYALYRVAVNAERFFEYDKAIRTYKLFYDKYDDDDLGDLPIQNFSVPEKRKNSLKGAAVLSANLQRYSEASDLYRQFVRAYPNDEDAAALQWRAVQNLEKAGKTRESFEAIRTYRREYGTAANIDRVFEGMTKIADYHRDRGDRRDATTWYEDILETYESRDISQAEDANFYASKAQFMLANYEFDDWDKLKIEGSLEQQKKRLNEKLEGAKEVRKEFDKVFKYKNLEWTLAANFRVGSLYQNFATSLYDVPIPFEPGSEEYNIYITQLEDVALPLEDKAIARYEKNIETARDRKVVNEWTKKTLEQLNSYMPDKYPLYKEERRAVRHRTLSGASFLDAESYETRQERNQGDTVDSTAGDTDGGS